MEPLESKINNILKSLKSQKANVNNTQKTNSKLPESNDVCPKCHGTGWILKQKDGNTYASECDCVQVERMKKILENSGIKGSFEKTDFKSYNPITEIQRKMKQMAQDYVLNFDRMKDTKQNSIAFLGQNGAGKTHLCVSIANVLMRKGIAVRYMSYREAITELKQVSTDEEYYQKRMNEYKRAKVLLIDDLFKGKITTTDINPVFEIINHRYFSGLPIILSSECGWNELRDYDEATMGRLWEMCREHQIEIKGEENNYRLRGIV